jgi:hypothetical protein
MPSTLRPNFRMANLTRQIGVRVTRKLCQGPPAECRGRAGWLGNCRKIAILATANLYSRTFVIGRGIDVGISA